MSGQVPIGPLQKAILLKINQVKKPLYVSELARQLKKGQPDVWNSIKPLVDMRFIAMFQETKGIKKNLALTNRGIAALFAYCDVDPITHYESRKAKYPPFVDIINKLFTDKDLKSQTFKNVYSFLLSDLGSTKYGDLEIEDNASEKHMTVLFSISQTAKAAIRYGDGLVNKEEYERFLDTLVSHAEKYAKRVKEEIQ